MENKANSSEKELLIVELDDRYEFSVVVFDPLQNNGNGCNNSGDCRGTLNDLSCTNSGTCFF